MRSVQIVPAPVESCPVGATTHGTTVADTCRPVIYELAQSGSFHTIDLSRSLKSELLSAPALARWNAAVRRVRLFLAVCHNLDFFITPVALLVSADVGRRLAFVILPLGLPSTISTLLALRYDVLYVLLGTYDFWFYWTVVVSTNASLGVYLGDARAVLAFFIALGMQICIFVDASVSSSCEFIVSSLLAGGLGCVSLLAVQLQLVPDVSNHRLSYNGRTAALPDFIANGLLTQVIVLARNAYRRRESVRHRAANKSSIQCITIRCTMIFRCVSNSTPPPVSSRRWHQSRPSTVPHLLGGHVAVSPLSTSEMTMVPIKEEFDGRQTLAGYQHSTQPWPVVVRWSLASISMTSASLTGVLFFYEVILDEVAPVGLSIASFVGSCLVSQVVWAMLQPSVLRRLWMSFDFVFLSFQLSILHACVCDTFQWDHRALLSIVGYFWIHVVMVLDALMPITRQRIGFHKALAMVVAFGFAAAHTGYFTKLIFDKHECGGMQARHSSA